MKNIFEKIKHKKIAATIGIMLPLVIVGAGFGIYFLLRDKDEKQITRSENKDNIVSGENNPITTKTENNLDGSIYEKMNIFPKINPFQFYDYLKIIDGEAVMDDDFISEVANYVLKNTHITDGKIFFDYKQSNKQNLEITFYWNHNSHDYWQTYTFTIPNV